MAKNGKIKNLSGEQIYPETTAEQVIYNDGEQETPIQYALEDVAIQANDAYDKANSAYDLANNAYEKANSAYSLANNAYNQANSAYCLASDAYCLASDAQGIACDAYWIAGSIYNRSEHRAEDKYAEGTYLLKATVDGSKNVTFEWVNEADYKNIQNS